MALYLLVRSWKQTEAKGPARWKLNWMWMTWGLIMVSDEFFYVIIIFHCLLHSAAYPCQFRNQNPDYGWYCLSTCKWVSAPHTGLVWSERIEQRFCDDNMQTLALSCYSELKCPNPKVTCALQEWTENRCELRSGPQRTAQYVPIMKDKKKIM